MQLKENKYLKKDILRVFLRMFFFLIYLSSCENKFDSIAKLSKIDVSADEVSDSLTIVYTDSSYVKVIVFGKRVEKFHSPQTKTLIKNGLKVSFFDHNENVSAILSSIEGEVKDKDGILICKKNVVFKNIEKNQTLYTEELNWDQNQKKIIAPGNVTIEKDNNFLYGTGLEANEDFSWYKIINPTAKILENNK